MELGDLGKDIQVWEKFGDDAKVLLQYVPRKKLNAINKATTKRELIKGQMVEVSDSDESNRKLGRAAVKGWENITVGGEPFEYSVENCDMLMDQSYEFSEFVNERCAKIQVFMEGKEDEAKKS